eukprot:m.1381839 g.1381839  ORF g.1381839 m.1381839 type:complete len:419 (+) comp24971_c2_seq30:215-1471(+)
MSGEHSVDSDETPLLQVGSSEKRESFSDGQARKTQLNSQRSSNNGSTRKSHTEESGEAMRAVLSHKSLSGSAVLPVTSTKTDSIGVALLATLLSVMAHMSISSTMFPPGTSRHYEVYVGLGLYWGLFAAALTNWWLFAATRFPSAVGGTLFPSIVIVRAFAIKNIGPEDPKTVMMAYILSTVVTGVVFVGLGRLGVLQRGFSLIPFPVVAGFLTYIGVCLLDTALSVPGVVPGISGGAGWTSMVNRHSWVQLLKTHALCCRCIPRWLCHVNLCNRYTGHVNCDRECTSVVLHCCEVIVMELSLRRGHWMPPVGAAVAVSALQRDWGWRPRWLVRGARHLPTVVAALMMVAVNGFHTKAREDGFLLVTTAGNNTRATFLDIFTLSPLAPDGHVSNRAARNGAEPRTHSQDRHAIGPTGG